MDGSVLTGVDKPRWKRTRKVEIMSFNLDLQAAARTVPSLGVCSTAARGRTQPVRPHQRDDAGAMNRRLSRGMAAAAMKARKRRSAGCGHQISRAALTSPLRPPYWNACSAITRWRNRWASFSSS